MAFCDRCIKQTGRSDPLVGGHGGWCCTHGEQTYLPRIPTELDMLTRTDHYEFPKFSKKWWDDEVAASIAEEEAAKAGSTAAEEEAA